MNEFHQALNSWNEDSLDKSMLNLREELERRDHKINLEQVSIRVKELEEKEHKFEQSEAGE